MLKWFKRCRHEWIIGEPTISYPADLYPAICRWCEKRTVLNKNKAHIHKEWKKLEIERSAWPK